MGYTTHTVIKGHIPSHAPLLEYTFSLGKKGRQAFVTVPENITTEEAERLCKIIESLPMDEA